MSLARCSPPASPSDSTPGFQNAVPFSETSRLLYTSDGDHHALQDLDNGHASLLSCVGNLTNTIIGSGMLAFPLAMASAGIIPGIITCVLSGSVAAFALYLLSLCARKTAHRKASYFAMAQLTFPWAAVLLDVAIAVQCFGISVTFLLVIKGLMPKVVETFYQLPMAAGAGPPAWALSGRVWIALIMLIVYPLGSLRRLDSLRHASYVGVFAVGYLFAIVVACYVQPLPGQQPAGETHLIHFTPSFISMIPVQIFAFGCSQNLPPLYNEMKHNTQRRMNALIGSSIGIATFTYGLIGVLGYLTFGSKVGANVMTMYPPSSIFVAVGQLAIVLLVMVSHPLQVHPCRLCLEHILRGSRAYQRLPGDSETRGREDDEPVVQDTSETEHVLLTIFIVTAGFVVAFFVNDLGMVLSFVGATGTTTVVFTLPGLYYWKLHQGDLASSRNLKWGAIALVVYGIGVCVFCLSHNFYQIFRGRG